MHFSRSSHRTTATRILVALATALVGVGLHVGVAGAAPRMLETADASVSADPSGLTFDVPVLVGSALADGSLTVTAPPGVELTGVEAPSPVDCTVTAATVSCTLPAGLAPGAVLVR